MIKEILRKRKARKNTEEYEHGFAWAMVEYHLNNQHTDDIECYLMGESGFFSHFDRGALQALFVITRTGENT